MPDQLLDLLARVVHGEWGNCAEHWRLFLYGLTVMPLRNSGTRERLIVRRASRPGGRRPEQLQNVLTRIDHVEWRN